MEVTVFGTIIIRKPKRDTVPDKLHYNEKSYTEKHNIVN